MDSKYDFLQPLMELENKIGELGRLSEETGVDMESEISSLSGKFQDKTREIFKDLSPWQRVLLARHQTRPESSDYIDAIFEDFVPLAGDRMFADDEAIMCGLGRLDGMRCMVIGHQKGKDVHERHRCHCGSPHPEGYRKAMLKMRLAEKFGIPVVCFINTPGAFPGVGAEERGQSIAIAENIRDMFDLAVPVVVVVIGEGGSGGALAIGVGNRVLMFENSYYSVISPEGCATILWKDAGRNIDAATALQLTAQSLLKLGVIDEILEEPAGGAHRQPSLACEVMKEALKRHLTELQKCTAKELRNERYDKFRALGEFTE
ncbi:MAG: acetyl-CoA carboxylase carboxyltransferase subunit alpha [Planctomycetes bacterium]|nr:acetyl-CoA carboxylase carboxyltransferase subunit alpha [Planctomycetota bacterium]